MAAVQVMTIHKSKGLGFDTVILPDIPDDPLEYGWTPKAITQIPAEMVVALAQGLEEPDDIALRCGFTPEQWKSLQNYKPLQVAVAAKKAELEKDGWIVRQKAAMGADMLLEPSDVDAVYRALFQAVSDGKLTEQRIDDSVQRILTAKIDGGLIA